MSLLLEALKKAEKAKEEAQRRARTGGADLDAPASAFDPEATAVEEGRHITTRDELPDISAPLEILSDDLRPAASGQAAPLELALAEEPPAAAPPPREPKPAPRRDAQRATAGQNTANAERATAQRVFEAKFKEPNPRLPVFITSGVLGAFALA